jgi:hypothetical protein
VTDLAERSLRSPSRQAAAANGTRLRPALDCFCSPIEARTVAIQSCTIVSWFANEVGAHRRELALSITASVEIAEELDDVLRSAWRDDLDSIAPQTARRSA